MGMLGVSFLVGGYEMWRRSFQQQGWRRFKWRWWFNPPPLAAGTELLSILSKNVKG